MSESTHGMTVTAVVRDDPWFVGGADSVSLLPSIALAATIVLLGLVIVGAAIS